MYKAGMYGKDIQVQNIHVLYHCIMHTHNDAKKSLEYVS